MKPGYGARYTKAATTTQRAYRGHQARKEARRRRSAKQEEDEKHRQALKIQSIARGRKDREKTKAERSDRMKNRAASQAAMRIQCAFRRKVASAKVRSVGCSSLERCIDSGLLGRILNFNAVQLANEFHRKFTRTNGFIHYNLWSAELET